MSMLTFQAIICNNDLIMQATPLGYYFFYGVTRLQSTCSQRVVESFSSSSACVFSSCLIMNSTGTSFVLSSFEWESTRKTDKSSFSNTISLFLVDRIGQSEALLML